MHVFAVLRYQAAKQLFYFCRYLTGQVDKRTLEKYEREAKEKNRETWYLSWALDTNQEERDKVGKNDVMFLRTYIHPILCMCM